MRAEAFRITLFRTTAMAVFSLASIATNPATAQDLPADQAAAGQPVEDIVVTGIRSSIESAAAQKRDASGILDAISSEDLGKFPDANVAESLQRIPGVAIDRNNGEGQSVTVRGLGPTFNTVLFNGRSFASDNYNRAFSFDLIPAELISGAQVYKSAQAPLQGGGIGATINIETPRPLDLRGFKGVFTGKALYEKNSDRFTPQLFGLLSDTFGDGEFGVLASVSYQRRIASIDRISTDGYIPRTTVGPNDAPLFTNVYAPRNQDINNTRDDRTRLGATLVAQWAPTDELTFTVDGLYNRFESEQRTRGLGSWFEPSNYTDATIDDNRTITSLTTNGNADFIASGSVRETTTYQVGFNTEWRPSDQVRMTFDATWSRARNDGGGRSFFTVIGVPTRYSFAGAQGGGLPSTFGYDEGALTDPARGLTHIAGINGNDVTERVNEQRWNTEWDPGFEGVSKIRFGVMRTMRDKSNVPITSDPNIGCTYCGYPIAADPGLLSPFTVSSFAGSDVPRTFLTYDANAYFDFLTSPAATSALDVARGQPVGTTAALFASTNGYAVSEQPSARVREVVYASYADVDLESEIAGMPLFVNIGGRYEYTELNSAGQQLQLTDLLPVTGDPTTYNGVFANGREAVPITQRSSYSNFLPAANIRLNLTERFQARFAAYRTLTRPAIGDLAPSLNYDTLRPATLTASGGNPSLRPYRADNLDFSLEWYPTRTTTVSAAVFYKKVDDFIVQSFADEVFPIANAGNLPVGGLIVAPNAAQFSVRRPRNAESLEIRGLELNLVHTLDWAPGVLSGFGLQANATFVETDREFDVTQTVQSFAAEGIGNSQNATLFYEKYGLSARIAYNRRERFLQTLAGGPGNEPVFVRNYGQFDGSIAYDITPFAQVFVEGTNLFNAQYITTGRFDNQVLTYQNFGPRYDAGVRFSF
ncbi:TonB-dependent receptor [Sphingomonas sp.]|uniref:TonB-dependent receptor n=1 Tax=Sphingomonas sp. TaxID=28214 RepID=UPI002BA34F63|nr:TonB-dependent receptor [Sphingomonas sp.]HTG38971.1 TonB-dependent receptor [Sphingomonas sp.]